MDITPTLWLHFLNAFEILDSRCPRKPGPRKPHWHTKRYQESEDIARIYCLPIWMFLIYEKEAIIAINNFKKNRTQVNTTDYASDFSTTATLEVSEVETAIFNYSAVVTPKLPEGWEMKKNSAILKCVVDHDVLKSDIENNGYFAQPSFLGNASNIDNSDVLETTHIIGAKKCPNIIEEEELPSFFIHNAKNEAVKEDIERQKLINEYVNLQIYEHEGLVKLNEFKEQLLPESRAIKTTVIRKELKTIEATEKLCIEGAVLEKEITIEELKVKLEQLKKAREELGR